MHLLTHTQASVFFSLFILCLLFPFSCCSFQKWTNSTELLSYIYLQPWLGNDCGKLQRKRKCEHWITGKTMCNSVVNQCPLICTLNDFNADFNLCGIWSSWGWKRALSYLQSAQIILSWAGSELTALAFWLNTFFSNMSGQAHVVWRNLRVNLRVIQAASNGHLDTEGRQIWVNWKRNSVLQ